MSARLDGKKGGLTSMVPDSHHPNQKPPVIDVATWVNIVNANKD